MATIAKLVLAMEAQFNGRAARNELGALTRSVNSFARNTAKVMKSLPNPADLVTSGRFGVEIGQSVRAAQLIKDLNAVREGLAETVKGFRKLRRDGVMDAEELAEAVSKARKQATQAGRQIIEATGPTIGLSEAEVKKIAQGWKSAGRRSAEEMVKGSRSVQAADKIASQLERDFRSREATLIGQRAVGGLTKKQYETRARENAAAYNLALAAEMERFAAAGKLTEPLRRAMTSKFKPEGFGVGAAASPSEVSMSRAVRSVDVLQRRMEQRVARARLDLAAKTISPEAFERRAFQAGQAFDRGLINVIGRMKATNTMSDEAERFLTRKFKVIGKKNADEGVFAAKEYVANFRDTYNRAIQSARFANAAGDLNSTKFKQATTDAAKHLAAGLKQVRDRLESEGLLTPAAQKFLNTQFAEAGHLAGKTFFARFKEAQADPEIANLRAVGDSLARAGSVLTKTFTLPVLAAGGASVKLAGDAEQSAKRLQIAFGPAAVELERRLQGMRQEMPATSGELRNMAAQLGELIIPLGLTNQAVAKMSTDLIRVTKNISLFAGVSTERAFNAVINGLVGQSRELKKLGVEIDDRTIRDRAYRDGIARVGAQLSTTQKVMAGYRVIMDRTRLIENTLAESQGTFNVRLLFFTARLKEAGITLGTTLLPHLTTMMVRLTAIADAFASMNKEQQRWVIGLALAAATIGPLLIMVGNLIKGVALYRAAIATAAGGGAAGAAAAGGVLGLRGILVAAGPAVAIITTLTAAVLGLKLAMKGADDTTAAFSRAMKGLSRDALKDAQIALAQAEKLMVKQQQDMLKAGKIQILEGEAGPIPFGPTEAIKEWERINKEIERFRSEQRMVKGELDDIDASYAQINKTLKEYEAKVKQSIDSNSMELLAETAHRVTRELGFMNAEAGRAKSALALAVKLKDADKVEEGIEGIRNAIQQAQALISQFQREAADPTNAPLAQQFEKAIDRAQRLQNELKGVLATAEKTRDMEKFGRALANVRAALTLGTKTNDLEAMSRGFQQAADLQEQLVTAINERRAKGDREAAERAQAMLDTLKTVIAEAQKFSPTEFIKTVDETIERLRLLKDEAGEGVITSTGIPVEGFDEASRLIDKLRDDYDYIDLLIQREQAAHRPVNELLREQHRILQAISAATPNLFERMFGKDFLPKIQEAADAIRIATSQEDAVKAAGGSPTAQREALLNVVRARAQLGALLADFQNAIKNLSPAQQAEALKGFMDAFKKANGEAGDFAETVSKADKRLFRMSLLARGIREIGEAFGFNSENADRMIRSIEAGIVSIQQFREIQKQSQQRRQTANAAAGATNPFAAPTGINFEELVGSIVSAASIFASAFNFVNGLVGAILGQSEAAREATNIVKQNNDRLEEMRVALDGFNANIGQQLKAQRALSTTRIDDAARTFNSGIALERLGLRPAGQSLAAFNKMLQGTGISLAYLNRVAKENNIQLLDSKGRIVVAALEQLREALGITTEAFFVYADTLADINKKTQLFNDVFNVPDTGQQAIQDQLGALEQLAPDIFRQFFAGVDLTNAAAVEAALQALTRALLDGTLAASDTLKLLDKGELEEIILGVAGGLDKLREATDDMTESMLNVPEWFKVNQVRFESVGPIEPPTLPPKQPLTEPEPFTPTVPGPPKGVRPTGQSIEVKGNVVFNINQQAGEDSDALADRILSKWRTEQFLRTGESTLPTDN